MTGHRCNPHRKGVTPATPPFFNPGCSACEAKAAKDPSIRALPTSQDNDRKARQRKAFKVNLFTPKRRILEPFPTRR